MPNPSETTVTPASAAAPGDRTPSEAALTLPERPLWKTLLVFLAPLLVANVLQSLSVTFNNIFIGQMLGVKALAAAAVVFPVMFLCIAFNIGLGAGAGVLIGQAWGARQRDTAREVAGTTLLLGLVLGLAVAVCGALFAGPLLRAISTPPDILSDATRVTRIILATLPGLFLFILATAMLRGVSDTLTPLYTLLLSTGIGLVLTPAFIRGWLGLPQLGVASAAWASVFSFGVALLWLVLRLRRIDSPLKPDREFLRHMHFNPRLLWKVLRVGIPTSVQMIAVALAEIVLVRMVNRYGSDAFAAYTAVNQVVAYVQIPAISLAIAVSILGAQAIGAGRTGRLGAIMRTALLMNLLFTGAVAALGYWLSRQFLGFFITSAPVVEMAQTLLHIMLWSVVVFGMAGVLAGIMRASGTVLAPMLISIGCILLVELPTAWIVSRRIGLNGVWTAYPAAFCSMLLLQWAYYQGVWRKREIRRLI